jgi:lipoprotein signal peptidase
VRTGIFNIADVAIMLGIGVFVLAEFQRKQEVASTTCADDGTA